VWCETRWRFVTISFQLWSNIAFTKIVFLLPSPRPLCSFLAPTLRRRYHLRKGTICISTLLTNVSEYQDLLCPLTFPQSAVAHYQPGLFPWASAASHGCTTACWLIVPPALDAPTLATRFPRVYRRVPHSSGGSWNLWAGNMTGNFA
jgi:hypothetical protein